MRAESFEVLGLPTQKVDPVTVEKAYRRERQTWFLRQFEPTWSIHARDRLRAIDEAFKLLKDPRRQAALLREIQSQRRQAERTMPAPDALSPPSSTNEHPGNQISRAKIVRKLLITAELIVGQSGRPLTAKEQAQLIREGFRLGLDFTDAESIVANIAQRQTATMNQKGR